MTRSSMLMEPVALSCYLLLVVGRFWMGTFCEHCCVSSPPTQGMFAARLKLYRGNAQPTGPQPVLPPYQKSKKKKKKNYGGDED